MQRIIFLVLVLMLMGAGQGHTAAQNDIQQAYLYDALNHDLYLMTYPAEGVPTRIELPFPPGTEEKFFGRVAIAPSGRYAAYVVTSADVYLGSGSYAATLVIYNLLANTSQLIPLGEIFGHSLNFNGSPFVYSGESLVIGLSMGSNWVIQTFDITTGAFQRQIGSSVPTVATVTQNKLYTLPLPVVTIANPDVVEFVMLELSAGEFAPPLPNYRWELKANTVVESNRTKTTSMDYLPGIDEVVEPMLLPSFPSDPSSFLMFQLNAIEVSTRDGERYPIVAGEFESFGRVQYVANGNMLAFTSQATQADTFDWIIMREDSNAQLLTDAQLQVGALIGTDHGLFAVADTDGLGTLLGLPIQPNSFAVVWLAAPWFDSPELIWVSPPDGNDVYDLIWTNMTGLVSRADFAMVPSINGGIIPPTAVAVQPPLILQVGGQAQVFTTEGDSLNMRSGAGTDFAIVDRLPNGTNLTLLEGAVSANGLQWWRVRVNATGREGWVIDFIDNIQTLIPLG
ncbi:MAG: SH3 domain-containing protein [Phototrophicaceae bacterium]|jgi:hypothetical protein